MTAALTRLRTVWLNRRYRRIHYGCPTITGQEDCCCGVPGCPDGGEGWPIRCDEPVSRLRWVLHGHCGQHGDGR